MPCAKGRSAGDSAAGCVRLPLARSGRGGRLTRVGFLADGVRTPSPHPALTPLPPLPHGERGNRDGVLMPSPPSPVQGEGGRGVRATGVSAKNLPLKGGSRGVRAGGSSPKSIGLRTRTSASPARHPARLTRHRRRSGPSRPRCSAASAVASRPSVPQAPRRSGPSRGGAYQCQW